MDKDIETLIEEIEQKKTKLSGDAIEFSDNHRFDSLKDNLVNCLRNCILFGDVVATQILDNENYFQSISKDLKAIKRMIPRPWGRGWPVWFRQSLGNPRTYRINIGPGRFPFERVHFRPHYPIFRKTARSQVLHKFILPEDITFSVDCIETNSGISEGDFEVKNWEFHINAGPMLYYYNKTISKNQIISLIEKMEKYVPHYTMRENECFWRESEIESTNIAEAFVKIRNWFENLLKRMVEDLDYTIEDRKMAPEEMSESDSSESVPKVPQVDDSILKILDWLKT